MIAEYAWRHQDKAKLFEPLSESLTQLREVFLYRHKLVQQRVAMEVRKKGKGVRRLIQGHVVHHTKEQTPNQGDRQCNQGM